MTPTVRNSTAGVLAYAPAPRMTSARAARLSPPWMAHFAEEFRLQGCAVFHDTEADAPWDLVVVPPPCRLWLVWAHAPITKGPLAVLVDSPLVRRAGARRAKFAHAAHAAGFVPIVATHHPGLPERALWTIEPA